MSEHEQNLRDLTAMFAMCGLIMRGERREKLAQTAYELADDMMYARGEEPEDEDDQGIAAIKPKRKYERKSTD
jgi:hypothetical protein